MNLAQLPQTLAIVQFNIGCTGEGGDQRVAALSTCFNIGSKAHRRTDAVGFYFIL